MTSLLKEKSKLIFVFVTLIISIFGFLVANDSFAWLSKNEEVTAKGLPISAKVSPNLIIATSEDAIKADDYILFSVDFEGASRQDMIAVTHDSNIPDTYLKYVDNHYAVDSKTGLVKPGLELDFKPVPATNNERYFIDHVVYIASAYLPLDVESITATILIPEFDAAQYPYFNAASIDFYVGEVSESGYRGTTSVAKAASDADDMSVTILSDATVPLNTEDCIKVIMRCYFDGALEDGTGKAYVNSYTVQTDGVVLGVEFFATEAAMTE